MLWNKVQRSFLFGCFLHRIPSLSLAFLLSAAPAALFPHVEHEVHSPGFLLKSLPPWNMTLGCISPLMQVLSTEQRSSPFRSYFRGLRGHEIGYNFNIHPLRRINLMLIVVKLLWRIVFLAMSDLVCLFLCNSSYVSSSFIQSTWNCLDEIRFVIAAITKIVMGKAVAVYLQNAVSNSYILCWTLQIASLVMKKWSSCEHKRFE